MGLLGLIIQLHHEPVEVLSERASLVTLKAKAMDMIISFIWLKTWTSYLTHTIFLDNVIMYMKWPYEIMGFNPQLLSGHV